MRQERLSYSAGREVGDLQRPIGQFVRKDGRLPTPTATQQSPDVLRVEEWKSGDVELAQRLSQGDSAAVEQLVSQYGEYLQRLIGNLMAWSGDTEDMMQETLLRAWSRAGEYRGDAPLKFWLAQIAVRLCRNRNRAVRRWFYHLTRVKELIAAPSHGTASVSDPRYDRTQRAMTQLSHSDRELLVLYYIEQRSLESLADQYQVKPETLHVRLHRARERLKKEIEAIPHE